MAPRAATRERRGGLANPTLSVSDEHGGHCCGREVHVHIVVPIAFGRKWRE
jgi:hypothetical protein